MNQTIINNKNIFDSEPHMHYRGVVREYDEGKYITYYDFILNEWIDGRYEGRSTHHNNDIIKPYTQKDLKRISLSEKYYNHRMHDNLLSQHTIKKYYPDDIIFRTLPMASGTLQGLYCPDCGELHTHGNTCGSRVAHCEGSVCNVYVISYYEPKDMEYLLNIVKEVV